MKNKLLLIALQFTALTITKEFARWQNRRQNMPPVLQ
tara:strand:+ start:290 stop:400 length:111 start_codon:yes stop_codon:yes gene_type:complete